MYRMRLLVLLPLLIVPPGCSGPGDPAAEPGDPKAVELLESHAAALLRGDCARRTSDSTPRSRPRYR